MSKTYIISIILFVLIATTSIIAQTRRSKEEEFLRRTINTEVAQHLSVTIKVCDPDGDPVVINIEDLPPGAILSDTYLIETAPEDNNDPNCADCFVDDGISWYGVDIEWTPTHQQVGAYTLYVNAIDDQGGDDWVMIVINVANKTIAATGCLNNLIFSLCTSPLQLLIRRRI